MAGSEIQWDGEGSTCSNYGIVFDQGHRRQTMEVEVTVVRSRGVGHCVYARVNVCVRRFELVCVRVWMYVHVRIRVYVCTCPCTCVRGSEYACYTQCDSGSSSIYIVIEVEKMEGSCRGHEVLGMPNMRSTVYVTRVALGVVENARSLKYYYY